MKALSLFSGAGGMDLGIRQAGFEVVACVEADPHCCATLRAAAAHDECSTQVFEADIRTMNPQQLLDALHLVPGELGLLFGGPPCQTFSQIGKQESLGDERGLLLFEMTRFAKTFAPRAVLIEQVKGVLTARDEYGQRGGVFERLVGELQDLGYEVAHRVILAAEFGVPQWRERLFIVAHAHSAPFMFPTPTHCEPGQALLGLPAYRTAGMALAGLPDPTPKATTCPPDDSHVDVTPAGDRRRIHGVPEGDWLARQTHLPTEQRGRLTRKDTTKFRRISSTEPANTLRCGEIFFHFNEDRILTPREYMRLHGYPDSYVLKGPIRSRSGRVRFLDQHRQVANSVPPPVAQAMGDAIREVLETCPQSLSFSGIG
jgi:DNA (cytosine-5)-methyltransferase 1